MVCLSEHSAATDMLCTSVNTEHTMATSVNTEHTMAIDMYLSAHWYMVYRSEHPTATDIPQ